MFLFAGNDKNLNNEKPYLDCTCCGNSYLADN
jgi:hypothetical protein